jgi:hypothetical protein
VQPVGRRAPFFRLRPIPSELNTRVVGARIDPAREATSCRIDIDG